MKQDLFKYLPPEATMNILVRLPVVTIMSCKCVCKSWLGLLETPEFVKYHLSESVPGLACFHDTGDQVVAWSKPYRFIEFVDESGPENNIERHLSIVCNFNLPHHEHEYIFSSVNGLLLLSDTKGSPRNHFICNPITRDYIKLPSPRESPHPDHFPIQIFGFGVSKMSGQYKVVRIFNESVFMRRRVLGQSQCEVYTLGTGSWRSIEPNITFKYAYGSKGMFLKGNLHWLVYNMPSPPASVRISCFDLETELFSIFSAPYLHGRDIALATLEECLVLCDNSYHDETVIWFMNEYGDDKSWTQKFIISSYNCYGVLCSGIFRPIKVFSNGDILIALESVSRILCYSNKTKTLWLTDEDELSSYTVRGVSYAPSFVPLKTFTLENVSSF